MSRLRVAPIVEGHGEEQAVRTLLDRIWREIIGGEYMDVLKPFRWPRSKLLIRSELSTAIQLAGLKLRDAERRNPMRSMILLLVDADEDRPCELGPRLLRDASSIDPRLDVACVIANVEYETWFVAAAESLDEYFKPGAFTLPAQPEQTGQGKGWVQQYIQRAKYSEPVDQPGMTARMDLRLCRSRSPSFDKLCRVLEARAQ